MRILDVAVSLTRKTIEKLAAECSSDSTAGTAAARLRGLTATACFAPLSGGAGGDEDPVRLPCHARVSSPFVVFLLSFRLFRFFRFLLGWRP